MTMTEESIRAEERERIAKELNSCATRLRAKAAWGAAYNFEQVAKYVRASGEKRSLGEVLAKAG